MCFQDPGKIKLVYELNQNKVLLKSNEWKNRGFSYVSLLLGFNMSMNYVRKNADRFTLYVFPSKGTAKVQHFFLMASLFFQKNEKKVNYFQTFKNQMVGRVNPRWEKMLSSSQRTLPLKAGAKVNTIL